MNTTSPAKLPSSRTEPLDLPADEVELNLAVAIGSIGTDPVIKVLPSGARLLSLSLTVRHSTEPATSVPVAFFDAPARVEALEAGSEVLVVGRMVRRFFRAGGQTQSRTELVADRIELTRRKATCRRILGHVEDLISANVAESFI